MRKPIFILGLVLLAGVTGVAGAAKVYRQVQPDGSVVFTDKRPDGDSDEINVVPAQGFQTPAPRSVVPDALPTQDDGFEGYTAFAVVSPGSDETIRDNNGVVPIKLSLEPVLQSNHKVEIVMDGQVLGSGRSLSLVLQSVDRGSHAIEATILDKDGAELMRTASITFHLQRASKLVP